MSGDLDAKLTAPPSHLEVAEGLYIAFRQEDGLDTERAFATNIEQLF
ncbi:hypothetical protein [Bradyrhizobium ottawaense]|nr:hypothetical protein [Bradyrhizobium ottawaense]